NIQEKSRENSSRPKRNYGNGKAIATIIIGVIIVANGSITKAQSTKTEDDPVQRAMTGVNRAVELRAIAAERVIRSLKRLKESINTAKTGERDQAITKLDEAEKLARENDEIQDNILITELLHSIAAERIKLTPKPVEPELALTDSINFVATRRYRSVMAR